MAAYSLLCVFLCVLFKSVLGAKKNVLFLVADDLRPNLGVYGNQGLHLGPSHTPNLDSLAGESVLFKRAYVQYAICSPSRTSFLTSRRPDSTRVYDLHTYFRHVGSNFTTIPQYFKQHGYQSEGVGKIFHPGKASGNDDPISWNSYHRVHGHHHYTLTHSSWRAVNDTERSQFPLVDDEIAAEAKKMLQNLAKSTKPFFLAVGFHKPHLPFLFPAKFLSDFPKSMVSLPLNPFAPVDMPTVAWSKYGELRSYSDIAKLNASGNINTTLPDDTVLQLRRAYFSAVSYMDSLVGDVLSELKRLHLENDTIISFIGDHGYSLGEHGLWCKHTNFEDAVHAPMMIRVPGLTDSGMATNKLVEFVDLFPTLVEAAEIPLLQTCPEDARLDVCTEGRSLLPLMKKPNSAWKEMAFSQYNRGQKVMGYTVRTDKYRYTEWVPFDHNTFKPEFSKMYNNELYDHVNDKQENANIAHHPENAKIVSELKKILHSGWRSTTHHSQIIG